MKFKHCLMLSVFFASLLIGALISISQSADATVTDKVVAAKANSTHRSYILPARHTHKYQAMDAQAL